MGGSSWSNSKRGLTKGAQRMGIMFASSDIRGLGRLNKRKTSKCLKGTRGEERNRLLHIPHEKMPTWSRTINHVSSGKGRGSIPAGTFSGRKWQVGGERVVVSLASNKR